MRGGSPREGAKQRCTESEIASFHLESQSFVAPYPPSTGTTGRRTGSQPLSRHRTFDGRGGAVKGVRKFGEVMAGEKGEVDIDVVLEKLRRVIRSGSQPKAIFDFVLKELRRSFARYTWAGVYMVEGE